ncbi:MAG: DUF262 domain-containing protein [Methylococcaceae bacterium]|nr:DUF262 domain-containing protein [Methylococcaceae bacterium]
MDHYTVEELETYGEEDYEQVPPSDIVAFNELRSCSDLLRLYKKGKLDIQPPFQREQVWQPKDYTRFIDSLIKQLPIPSLCFSHDYKTQKWQVIDGLQRMSSIIKFLDEKNWKFSNLDDVDKRISGLKAEDIQNEESDLYELYERVENLTIPITVLRCDFNKKSHTNYLFTIFHRLNSGGTKLNNQEIRNCIFSGKFNDLLKELNDSDSWKKINDIQEEKKYRFATVELILRFFAFHDGLNKYKGRLARFLNEYMNKNKDADLQFLNNKKQLFERVTALISENISESTLHSLNLTTIEAIMYGVSQNINMLEEKNSSEITQAIQRLQDSSEFSSENLRGGLSSTGNVNSRLECAKKTFEL